MKKCVAIACGCIIVLAVLLMLPRGSSVDVPEFDLDDKYFVYSLQRFPSDAQIDALIVPKRVKTPEEAAAIAETVWFELFGEETIIDERPYVVSFDRKNGVWWVSGTLNYWQMGGVANILIRKRDSAVLAAWHDR